MELKISKFENYVKGRDNQLPYPFSEKDVGVISASVDDDLDPLGLEGSPQMLDKSQPPLTRIEKKDLAKPEYKKGDGLKDQKESVESEEVINEGRDPDDNYMYSHTGEKFTPALSEAHRYNSKMIARHKDIADKFVRSAHSHGALPNLMEAIMGHPDAYGHMVENFAHPEEGPKRSRKLARSLDMAHKNYMAEHFGGFSESVDAPRGDFGSMAPTVNTGAPGDGFGMAQGMASPMGMQTPQPMSMPSNAQSSMGAAPLSMPSTPATEGRKMARLGHDNILSEMAKFPYSKNYLKEGYGY